jgi:hypothetical protein
VSFATIGNAWLNHSVITEYLERADAILLRLNLVLLFSVRTETGRGPGGGRRFVLLLRGAGSGSAARRGGTLPRSGGPARPGQPLQ